MKTNYEQQAQAFLEHFKIKFTATLTDSKGAPWTTTESVLRQTKRFGMEIQPHHYRVTLSRRRTVSRVGLSFVAYSLTHTAHITFDFWGSIADAEANRTAITPYDVLACISGDTHCADTFEDWCSEFGESTDSRKAEQTYKRCAAFAKRLQAFFTAQEIEALQEIQ